MSIPLTTYIKQKSDFCLFLNFCLTYVLTATARTPGQYKQKYRVGPVTSGGADPVFSRPAARAAVVIQLISLCPAQAASRRSRRESGA